MSTLADEKVDNIGDSCSNLFQQAEESTGTTTTRPQRNSKRSARSRILESFRDSPLARGSECVYPSIISCHISLGNANEDNKHFELKLENIFLPIIFYRAHHHFAPAIVL